MQAHAKEPSAKEAVQPNAREGGHPAGLSKPLDAASLRGTNKIFVLI